MFIITVGHACKISKTCRDGDEWTNRRSVISTYKCISRSTRKFVSADKDDSVKLRS